MFYLKCRLPTVKNTYFFFSVSRNSAMTLLGRLSLRHWWKVFVDFLSDMDERYLLTFSQIRYGWKVFVYICSNIDEKYLFTFSQTMLICLLLFQKYSSHTGCHFSDDLTSFKSMLFEIVRVLFSVEERKCIL